MPLLPPPPPPINLGLEGFPTVQVNFDNSSHVSGHRRALINSVDCHEGCRLDAFLHHHGGCTKRTAAYLFAWAVFGSDCVSKEEHVARKPTPAEVNVIYDMRFAS